MFFQVGVSLLPASPKLTTIATRVLTGTELCEFSEAPRFTVQALIARSLRFAWLSGRQSLNRRNLLLEILPLKERYRERGEGGGVDRQEHQRPRQRAARRGVGF